MKRAFGLPQAIMIILFVGSIVLIGMKFSQIGAKHYSDTYINEQAKLILQSAKERALFAISGHERSTNCWSGENNIEYRNGNIAFDVNITVERYYLLQGTPDVATCGALTQTIQTPESHGMVKLLITVADSTGRTKIANRSIQRP